MTCFFAIAKTVAQYTGKEGAAAGNPPTAVSPTGSVTSHPTSLSSGEPGPTPCSSPVAITPEEITTRFWDSTLNGRDASSYLAALKGVCVEWRSRFWSAERMKTNSDEILIPLRTQVSRHTSTFVFHTRHMNASLCSVTITLYAYR